MALSSSTWGKPLVRSQLTDRPTSNLAGYAVGADIVKTTPPVFVAEAHAATLVDVHGNRTSAAAW
jgi:hypothetical protein